MIQRQVTHPPGTFALCKKCSREPRHYVASGHSTKDPIDVRLPSPDRHILECCCSGIECRTELLPSLAAANIQWRERFGIPQKRTRKAA